MKRICLTLLPILALAVPSTQAGAQSWPTRPIRAIVPCTAGSGTDVTARVILNQLSSELGQSIVVENRVGAGGTIGTAAAARADPDGYTILVQSSALTIAPSIYQNLAYDTARDLAAVTPLGISPNVLIISPSRGIRTIHELVSAAKAKPGSLTFASAGGDPKDEHEDEQQPDQSHRPAHSTHHVVHHAVPLSIHVCCRDGVNAAIGSQSLSPPRRSRG
jgi:tripartite-type tricarboxylate transporter receptor subunit TctC